MIMTETDGNMKTGYMRAKFIGCILLAAMSAVIHRDGLFAEDALREESAPFAFGVRTGISYSGHATTLKYHGNGEHPEHGYSEIDYCANNPYAYNLEMTYRQFGFSMSRSTGKMADDTEKYGKTESRDYQAYLFGRSIGVDIFYQKYQGFYLDYPEKFGLTTGDPSIRRDLKIRTRGVNLYYALFDELNLAAAFKQSERQLRSGGSFLMMISITDSGIEGDHSLIPLSEQPYYDQYSGMKKASYTSAYVSAGYGYNFIHGPLYCALMFFAGGGGGYTKITTGEESFGKSAVGYKMNFKLSAGYNGDTVLLGLYFFSDFSNVFIMTSGNFFRIDTSLGSMGIFAGVRF